MPHPVTTSNIHRTAAPHAEQSKNEDAASDVRKASGVVVVVFVILALPSIGAGIAQFISHGDMAAGIMSLVAGFAILLFGWVTSLVLNALAAIVDNTKASADNTRQLLAKLSQHSSFGA